MKKLPFHHWGNGSVEWGQNRENDLPEFREGGGLRADERYTVHKRVRGRNNPSNDMTRCPRRTFRKRKKGGPPGPRVSSTHRKIRLDTEATARGLSAAWLLVYMK